MRSNSSMSFIPPSLKLKPPSCNQKKPIGGGCVYRIITSFPVHIMITSWPAVMRFLNACYAPRKGAEELISMNKWSVSIGLVIAVVMSSCSSSGRISKAAKRFYADSSLAGAEVGISVFDPSKNKYLYNHGAENYFVP